MRLEIVRTCRGFLPHFFDADGLWATRGRRLYRSTDLGATWQAQAVVRSDLRGRIVSRVRLLDRFLRATAFSVVRLGDGSLVAFTGHDQHLLRPGAHRFVPIPDSPIDYKPLRRGVGADARGRLRVGDYRDNFGEDPGDRVRAPVHILRTADPLAGPAAWETAHTFGPGQVRHIHAILDDPFVPGRTWVCTGDTDAESAIAWSDDDLATLTPFSAEGQRSRAVDLLFTPTHLVWGIDSPLQQSGIVRKPRDGGPLEWLCDTPCPIYYGATNAAGHLFLATCVEPGPSVTSNRTALYASVDGTHFAQVASRRADPLPQGSQIHLPAGPAPGDHVVFSCRATLRWENTLIVGRLRHP